MKYIIITGGVLSGIGKGITAASIGAILKSAGYKVFMQKFDGYLNVDPGTMSPFQHGEVFVTHDGAETDLDLGHYERFINTDLNGYSSFSSGKLYQEILQNEREGKFLGKTVQIVPHLTDLVKSKIRDGAQSVNADISIVEIGGTVGDMENEYYLEAVRQLQTDLGKENVIFIHVTLLPYIKASKEMKSKPTQHSVRDLMSYGIIPDFLVLRSDYKIPKEMCEKVSRFCNIKSEFVIPAATVKSVYQIPLNFQKLKMGENILEKLSLPKQKFEMSDWKNLIENIKNSTDKINIAMVGKYNDLEDAYFSLNEGLKTAGFYYKKKVKLHFIDATGIEKNGCDVLKNMDGICVPGGFGERGIEGMIQACHYARINKIPYLGICLGSQIMSIEFARNELGLQDANSQEFNPNTKNPVVHLMESQKDLHTKGGNMRLGSYECEITPDSKAFEVYKETLITERHRHRYEFNAKYEQKLAEKGFIVSGKHPASKLAEIVEIKNHPFMIGTQAHPEYRSRPTHPHPLFLGFIQAMIK